MSNLLCWEKSRGHEEKERKNKDICGEAGFHKRPIGVVTYTGML
jgi:hypothetical protein